MAGTGVRRVAAPVDRRMVAAPAVVALVVVPVAREAVRVAMVAGANAHNDSVMTAPLIEFNQRRWSVSIDF